MYYCYAFSISIYSEAAEYPMATVTRKKAPKSFSIDKSAIDKGNSGYDEVQHQDGKVSIL